MTRIWVLVEWVEESDVLPSYGVMNVNTLAYDDNELHPGNEIFIRVHRGEPKRAKIVRISESKRYLQEHKDALERQDKQVKSMLQMCMRTIREVKSNNVVPCGVQYNTPQASNHMAMPPVIDAINSDSGSASDSESESNRQLERSIIQSYNRARAQFPKYGRKAPKIQPVRGVLNTAQIRRPSVAANYPLSDDEAQRNDVLRYDQGTQTEPTAEEICRVEELEALLKMLYKKFQNIIAQVNMQNDSSISSSLSDCEESNEVSYDEQSNSGSWTERNHTDYEDQVNEPVHVEDIGAEQALPQNGANQSMNSSNVRVEERTPKVLRVRRMSAQTTNNIETPPNDTDLVPIGDGNTKVPARLLNEINWNSHTTATRQLLQAVFPRRVLATHCLTGKQSPAFMNRPPKKILDPKLVEDIVKIVSTRCGVPKNLVRNSITIKCTDEAKLYRNRLQYKLQRRMNANDENRPPSTPSSDDSAHAVIN